MIKKQWKYAAIILGIIFDYLFWEKNPGISFSIFVMTFISASFILLKIDKTPLSSRNLFLFFPILFFSVMSFIRRDPFTNFLNYLLTIFSLSVFVISFQNGQWGSFGLVDYIANLFHLAFNTLKFPFFRVSLDQPDTSSNKERLRTKTWAILRGALITIPILYIFIILFSSADLVFEQKTYQLLNLMNLQNLPELFFRSVLILIMANLFSGVMLHASVESAKVNPSHKPIFVKFLGFTEACIVLGSVLTLFLFFIGVQFQYFFFPKQNIAFSGFSYAEYARRGFTELVIIAFLSLLLILSLNLLTNRKTISQNKLFKFLNVGLVFSVLIILGSSFQRLLLYESAFGFTQSRTYAHVFMIWLGLLLASVVVLEYVNKGWAITNAAIIVLIGFSATLNMINVDAFIAHQNIQRAKNGKALDVSYLSSLTNDAVPTLVNEISASDISEEMRDGIGAAITCFQVKENRNKLITNSWQSFHISDWKAERMLVQVSDHIQGYQIQEEDWYTSIISPAGVKYTCQNYFMFD